MQCQQPEQPGRVGAQRVVRPGQHGAQVGRRILVGELVQAALCPAQLVAYSGQRYPGLDRRARRDDGQREGQPGGALDDLVDRPGFGGHPPRPEPVAQQPPGLVAAEQVQRDRVRTLGGDQAGELVAAGDDDRAPGCAGQQRPDLLGVAGVVRDDQYPPAGEQAAVHVDLRGQLGRYPRRRATECLQEHPQRLARLHRRPGRVEAAQVDVELAVREPVPHLVCPVHGERGLTHPGGTGDRRDHDRGRLPAGGVQQRVKLCQLVGPAGEPPHVQRQQGRHGTRRRPGRYRCRLVVPAAQDRPVRPLELGNGIHAQLLGQPPADRGVAVQRPGPVAGRGQRPHQRGGQRLDQRVLAGQRGQRPGHRRPVAPAELQLRPGHRDGEAFLVQSLPYLGHPPAAEPGQRLATPAVQCRAQQPGTLLVGYPGRRGPVDQPAHPQQVDPLGVHVDRVATGTAVQRRRYPRRADLGEQPADPAEVRVQRAAHLRRCAGVPDPVDQRLHVDGPARVDEQRGQHAPALGGAEIQRPPAEPRLHRSEQPELDHRGTPIWTDDCASATITPSPPGPQESSKVPSMGREP